MSDKSRKILQLTIDIITMTILIVVDQYTKKLAVINLKDKPAINIFDNVFQLYYLENRGAAFGMFQNHKEVFIFIAFVMLFLVFYVLYKIPNTKKYYLFEFALVLIGSGAIGNMIDRVTNDYVVDFFYFILINFPIFNVADIYVTVSCVLLLILILWVYKEEDLAFLSTKILKINSNKHKDK